MIASGLCSDHAFSIVNDRAPWAARQKAIRSIYDLYAKCFTNRCAQGLGHTSEVTNPINAVCYMWWDLFPAWPDPKDASLSDEADEYIQVMERCLSLTHQACLEGALHGLGHWQLIFPERVEPIVDQFLRDAERPAAGVGALCTSRARWRGAVIVANLRRLLTTHCNGPTGRNGFCAINVDRCPAGC